MRRMKGLALTIGLAGLVLPSSLLADLIEITGTDGAPGAPGADGDAGETISFLFVPLDGPPHGVSLVGGRGGAGGAALPGGVGGTGGAGGASVIELGTEQGARGVLELSSRGGAGGAGGALATNGTIGDGGAGGDADLLGSQRNLLVSATAVGGRGGNGSNGGGGGNVYAYPTTSGAPEVNVRLLGGSGGDAVGTGIGFGGAGGWVVPNAFISGAPLVDVATYQVRSGDGGSVILGTGDGGDSGEISSGILFSAAHRNVVNLTGGNGGDGRGEGYRGGLGGWVDGELYVRGAGAPEVDVSVRGGSGGDGLDGALAGGGAEVRYGVTVEGDGPINVRFAGVGGEAGSDAEDPADRSHVGGTVTLFTNIRATGNEAVSADLLAVGASNSRDPRIGITAEHAGAGSTTLTALGVVGDFTLGGRTDIEVSGVTASGELMIHAESDGSFAAPGIDGGDQLRGADDRNQRNHVRAEGHSTGAGDVFITVIDRAQHAGDLVGTRHSAGGDVALVDAVTGSTVGALALQQIAVAGNGARDLDTQPFGGSGGDAYSLLDVTNEGSLSLFAEATGGQAGVRDLSAWGTPGNATASARGIGSLDPVDVYAGAHAGDANMLPDPFWDTYERGPGGRADAEATAVGLGDARAHAVADAGRYGFHGSLYPPELPQPIADALSAAQGSTGLASAVATASFLENKPQFSPCEGVLGTLANACDVSHPEVSALAVSPIGTSGAAHARAQASVLSFTDAVDPSTHPGAYAVIEAVPFTSRVDQKLVGHSALQDLFGPVLALGALGTDVPDDFDPATITGLRGSEVAISLGLEDINLRRLALAFLGAETDLPVGDFGGGLFLRVDVEGARVFERTFGDLAETLLFFDDTLLALDTRGISVTDDLDVAIVLEFDETAAAARFGFEFLLVESTVGPTISVELDIRPRSRHNRINLSGRRYVRVAIMGSEHFDAADVDVDSLAFGPNGVSPVKPRRGRGHHFHLRDVDRDSYRDLLVRFDVREAGLSVGDTEACAMGATADGYKFEGCDAIETSNSSH